MTASIRELKKENIKSCAQILAAVYNNELWQCRWTQQKAEDYLLDYYDAKKFLGYVTLNENGVIGAIFTHKKIWWNNNEIYIDELFIHPDFQGQGFGTALLKRVEEYIKERKLAGFTLVTNRFAPAPKFYKKNGFVDCEHLLFMAKEIE